MNILECCLNASRGTLTEQDIQLYKKEHTIHATEPHLQRNPLHYAAYFGQKEMVRLLIESGINLNAQDKEGNTPLHLAALKKHYDVIDMLIEQNADPLKENLKSQTPLMVHCTHNHQVENNDRHNAVGDMLKHEMLKLRVQDNPQLAQCFPAINPIGKLSFHETIESAKKASQEGIDPALSLLFPNLFPTNLKALNVEGSVFASSQYSSAVTLVNNFNRPTTKELNPTQLNNRVELSLFKSKIPLTTFDESSNEFNFLKKLYDIAINAEETNDTEWKKKINQLYEEMSLEILCSDPFFKKIIENIREEIDLTSKIVSKFPLSLSNK